MAAADAGGAPPTGASIREHGLEAVGRLILKMPGYFLPDLASVNAERRGTSRTSPYSAKGRAAPHLGYSDPEGPRCGCGRHLFFSYSSCWLWIWGYSTAGPAR